MLRPVASIQHTYSISGVTVEVEFRQREQATQLDHLWRQFFALVDGHTLSSDARVRLMFEAAGGAWTGLETGEEIFSSTALRVLKTKAGFLLERGESFLSLDLVTSCGAGCLDSNFWHIPWQDQREFFLLTLLMLFRRHGRYGLHANGLAWESSGCLVAGYSGSGKTTLALALLNTGWRYLSDDALMLCSAPGDIEAQAFRRGFSLTQDTIERFLPQVDAVHLGRALQDGKQLVDLSGIYPERFVERCLPRLLLFPVITAGRRSRLVRAGATQAVTALVQQSPGILVDVHAARAQLDLLKRLAEQATGYELQLGLDVYDDPQPVSELLRSALGG